MGIILDSSVVIAAERGSYSPLELITQVMLVTGNQDAGLSSIGLTELVHGIYRAKSASSQMKRKTFVEDLRSGLAVYPYTTETAMIAGRIDGGQKALGVTIPFADLLIGATALELGFSVLTGNERHFRLIPGLTVLTF